jgi:hypothetical protein
VGVFESSIPNVPFAEINAALMMKRNDARSESRFSALAFLADEPWGVAPGWSKCCAFGAKHSLQDNAFRLCTGKI